MAPSVYIYSDSFLIIGTPHALPLYQPILWTFFFLGVRDLHLRHPSKDVDLSGAKHPKRNAILCARDEHIDDADRGSRNIFFSHRIWKSWPRAVYRRHNLSLIHDLIGTRWSRFSDQGVCDRWLLTGGWRDMGRSSWSVGTWFWVSLWPSEAVFPDSVKQLVTKSVWKSLLIVGLKYVKLSL